MDGALRHQLVQTVLDPSPDVARSKLRQELLKPEYDDVDPFTRLINWFLGQFDGGLNTASGSPILSTLAAVAIFALLVGGGAWLASRARRTAQAGVLSGPVVADSRLSATEYRRRAEESLAAGDFNTTVIEGFRALARQQIESGRIEDLPQATAREVSALLGMNFADHSASLITASRLFDTVLYGDHHASRDEAISIISLDDRLGAKR